MLLFSHDGLVRASQTPHPVTVLRFCSNAHLLNIQIMKEISHGCPQSSPGPARPAPRADPASTWHRRPSAPGASGSVSRGAAPLARGSSRVCESICLRFRKAVWLGVALRIGGVLVSLGPAEPSAARLASPGTSAARLAVVPGCSSSLLRPRLLLRVLPLSLVSKSFD